MFEKGIVKIQNIMKSCVFPSLTIENCVFNIMEYNSLLSAIPWKQIISAYTNASKNN